MSSRTLTPSGVAPCFSFLRTRLGLRREGLDPLRREGSYQEPRGGPACLHKAFEGRLRGARATKYHLPSFLETTQMLILLMLIVGLRVEIGVTR
jgi:hypothetical protein